MTTSAPQPTARRADPRHEMQLVVRYKYPGQNDFIERYSSNVSASGIFIATDKAQPVGSELSFEIQAADGSALFKGKGIVRWVREHAPEKKQVGGVGVQFSQLDDASRELLRRMMERKLQAVVHSPVDTPAPAPGPAAIASSQAAAPATRVVPPPPPLLSAPPVAAEAASAVAPEAVPVRSNQRWAKAAVLVIFAMFLTGLGLYGRWKYLPDIHMPPSPSVRAHERMASKAPRKVPTSVPAPAPAAPATTPAPTPPTLAAAPKSAQPSPAPVVAAAPLAPTPPPTLAAAPKPPPPSPAPAVAALAPRVDAPAEPPLSAPSEPVAETKAPAEVPPEETPKPAVHRPRRALAAQAEAPKPPPEELPMPPPPDALMGGMLRNKISFRKGVVQLCYERALKNNPNLKGDVMVEVTIAAGGSVRKVDVLENTLRDPGVARCFEDRIRAMNFPGVQEEITLQVPFRLRQADGPAKDGALVSSGVP